MKAARNQLSLFALAQPAPMLAPAHCFTSLQARVAREGGGPACRRVPVAIPGYPIEHYHQVVPGLMVSVVFPHRLAHWPEGEPVLTRITRGHADGAIAFTVGAYEYKLRDLPTAPLAYPNGLGVRPDSWALLVAGDQVQVQPDEGKPYVATLLDTLWMRPNRDEVKLRVCTWPDISRYVLKKAAISTICSAPGYLENFAEQHLINQSWGAYRFARQEVASG